MARVHPMRGVLHSDSPDQKNIEAGAAAGTKAFCKRNKPKKVMHEASPTNEESRQPGDGSETPATPVRTNSSGYTALATPAKYSSHPQKSSAPGTDMLGLDGGRLSGVIGWEKSDGKTMKLCMDRLMTPRRVVLKEDGPKHHDSCTQDNAPVPKDSNTMDNV